jgi:hypothetical protein
VSLLRSRERVVTARLVGKERMATSGKEGCEWMAESPMGFMSISRLMGEWSMAPPLLYISFEFPRLSQHDERGEHVTTVNAKRGPSGSRGM